MDENCYDQFSVIYDCGANAGSTTAIYLNSIPEPQEIQKREVGSVQIYIKAIMMYKNWVTTEECKFFSF